MTRYLYTLAGYLLLAPVFCAVLWFRGFRDRRYWHNFGERFGLGRTLERPSLWVHAVSVGEVQAAAVLVRALHERYPGVPLVVTTLTPTGEERARAVLGDRADVRYMPLDLPGSVRRFFDRARPKIAVIFETELWPNLFHECGRRGVPLVLASARISPRSVGKYRRFIPLFRDALSNGIVIAAQAEEDAARFLSLGANPLRTHVTGNLKFDFALPPDVNAKGRSLREHYATGRPVWVAGSTHEGEEEQVLDAHARVREAVPGAFLVLAPRHYNRFEAVAALLRRRGVSFVTRSDGGRPTAHTQVLLVDSLGELLNFYAAADVAFVGGSLVPVGGHNLLEPAALSLPVLTGPHNFNSERIAYLMMEVGAARVVDSADALADEVVALLRDSQERARMGGRGKLTLDANRGALQRLIALIDPLLKK